MLVLSKNNLNSRYNISYELSLNLTFCTRCYMLPKALLKTRLLVREPFMTIE